MTSLIHSIPGICDVQRLSATGSSSDSSPNLLIEVPHGATTTEHFTQIRDRLKSSLPKDLDAFYYVNTDVGAPECAQAIGEMLTDVWTIRCLVPRTFIDCNRVVGVGPDHDSREELTSAIPDYITEPEDRELLETAYRSYLTLVDEAYRVVCTSGGLALCLHTYAPRSVQIGNIDGEIVDKLKQAYSPELYSKWDRRPDVDVISETVDGEYLAPRRIVEKLRSNFGEIGIEATENASYRLHPATQAYRYSREYPGQILCVELSRALLADPFRPFEPMTISDANARRMAAPIAAAIAPDD